MEEVITLQVPVWLLRTIDIGLQGLPWNQANPALVEINRQLAEQRAVQSVPSTLNGSSAKPSAADGAGSA